MPETNGPRVVGIVPTVWAGVLIAAIAAVPPTITAWNSGRQLEAKVAHVETKVAEVHALANSRLTAALGKLDSLALIVERQRATLEALGASRRRSSGR